MVNPYNWKVVVNWDDMGDAPDGNTIWMPRIQMVDETGRIIMTFEGNSFDEMATIAAIVVSMLTVQLNSLGNIGRGINWNDAVSGMRNTFNQQINTPPQ